LGGIRIIVGVALLALLPERMRVWEIYRWFRFAPPTRLPSNRLAPFDPASRQHLNRLLGPVRGSGLAAAPDPNRSLALIRTDLVAPEAFRAPRRNIRRD